MRKAALLIMLFLTVFACERKQPEPRPQTKMPAVPAIKGENEINLLKSILKEDPDNLQALIKLGNISMDSNRFQQAIDAYSKALEIDPRNVNVRVDMGTCYRRSGRSDKALEEFQKAIEIDPNHKYAHMNLGVVLAYDFDNKEEAIKALEKYIELAPTAPNVPQVREFIERLKAQM
jgi:tetratricopeptide (TPR) repeat protein